MLIIPQDILERINWYNHASKLNSIMSLRHNIFTYLGNKKKYERSLDAGCGPGTCFPYLDLISNEVYAIDNEEIMLAEALKNFPYKFAVNGNLLNMPFRNNIFDICYCERVLQHIKIEYIKNIMSEFYRVVNNHGYIVIVDSDQSSFRVCSDDPTIKKLESNRLLNHVVNPTSGRSLQKIVADANFKIVNTFDKKVYFNKSETLRQLKWALKDVEVSERNNIYQILNGMCADNCSYLYMSAIIATK
jgi:ubiquinone/menaquinone biosynthesis C-methylase UbiE